MVALVVALLAVAVASSEVAAAAIHMPYILQNSDGGGARAYLQLKKATSSRSLLPPRGLGGDEGAAI